MILAISNLGVEMSASNDLLMSMQGLVSGLSIEIRNLKAHVDNRFELLDSKMSDLQASFKQEPSGRFKQQEQIEIKFPAKPFSLDDIKNLVEDPESSFTGRFQDWLSSAESRYCPEKKLTAMR